MNEEIVGTCPLCGKTMYESDLVPFVETDICDECFNSDNIDDETLDYFNEQITK